MREININQIMEQLGFSSSQLERWQAIQAKSIRKSCEFAITSISVLTEPSMGPHIMNSTQQAVNS